MMRRIAVVGDTLTSGGHILDYEQRTGFTFHGHKTALIGEQAYCETCKSTGMIAKAGGPYRIHYLTTHEAALDRDIVLCKCPTPPAIVAKLAGESWCEDRDSDYTARVAPLAGYANRSDNSTGQYDEQVRAVAARTSLVGYPYYIETSSGDVFSGRIDSRGLLPRISTNGEDQYTVYWGDEALAKQANA